MGEETSIPGMKDLTSTSFGYVIGFLLPGMLGIYGFSKWFFSLQSLLQPIVKADATVGPSVVFLLSAVGMGLCVSSARYFIFEKWLYRKRCLSPEMYKGLNADKLALHKSLAEEHYRYHQFYGGCAVSVLVLFIGWVHGQWPFGWKVAYVTVGFLLCELLLERSASDCFGKYIDKCNEMGKA